MKIKIKREGFIKWYIALFNGFLNLTPKEIIILEAFIKEKSNLEKEITNSNLVNLQLFSTQSRKKIRESCEISSENLFNNYLGSLKKKKVIEKSGDSYKLSEKILPKEKVLFEIEFID